MTRSFPLPHCALIATIFTTLLLPTASSSQKPLEESSAPIFSHTTPETYDHKSDHSSAPQAGISATRWPLTIRFEGLIAWKIDGATAWAVLPDADYDLDNFDRSTPDWKLPPGVRDMALMEEDLAAAREFLKSNFPPHVASITITGAKPVRNLLQGTPLPIRDYRVTAAYPSELKTPIGVAIQATLTARHFSTVGNTQVDASKALTLAQFSTHALAALRGGGSLPPGISSAIQLKSGMLSAMPDPTFTRLYSIKSPTQNHCPPPSPFSLAPAEVAELRDWVEGGESLILTFLGASFKLEPLDTGVGVTLTIRNALDHTIANADHPQAFRWFYNLAQSPTPETQHHYFPCCLTCSLGGNKCPFYWLD